MIALHTSMRPGPAVQLTAAVIVLLHAPATVVHAQPGTVTVEFRANGECTVRARGEGFRSEMTYTQPPGTRAQQFRCAVPPVPPGRSVKLSVRLPSGAPRPGGSAPSLAWTRQGNVWVGTAAVPAMPDVVAIHRSASRTDAPGLRKAAAKGPKNATAGVVRLRRSEWIAASYFVYLLVTTGFIALPAGRRLAVGLAALIGAAIVVGVSTLPDVLPERVIRDWAPGVYLLWGYWLPGQLFTKPNERLERWLIRTDERLPGMTAGVPFRNVPRALREYLEFSYLFCYPLVPVAFGVVYFAIGGFAAESIAPADRFWSVVLLSSYLCFGVLPWLPTRPPRAIMAVPEGETTAERGLRDVNLLVLNHASIRVNTFPSAHVAGSIAAALGVWAIAPAAGAIVAVIAASIAVAAVVGRYHYAADAVIGAIIPFVVFAILR